MKRQRGQFYTVKSSYILDGFHLPQRARCIIEPFAGKGDLLDWLKENGNTLPVESYDIEPKHPDVVQRDTLCNPPDYRDAWVLTNPPYLARNKCSDKELFEQYNTNDLYKCFILSVQECCGGIFIIPAGFFLSPRDIDVRCRSAFLSRYKLLKVKYFEEAVFPDTTTTVVAFQFERSETILTEQDVEWVSMPSGQTCTFSMRAEHDWIIGGDVYTLPLSDTIKVGRYVEGQSMDNITYMTLKALDSGTHDGRISLSYKEGYVYPAKDCSRTYATLRINIPLTAEQQRKLCLDFNTFLEQKRDETWSLFLPQYRESKEYARKRIPFELAYRIVGYLISRDILGST